MRKYGLLAVAVLFLAVVFSGCATTGGTEQAGGTATAAAAPTGSGNKVNLWNFESKTADGWAGNGKWAERLTVNTDPKFVKEGGFSLKIDAKGCKGWEQNIALNGGPFPEQFAKLASLTMDVYVPKESIKGMEYAQIFLVVSGSANSWYQVQQGIKEGWNSLEYKIEPGAIDGDIWKVYFVFNSGGTFSGPVYIDNVVGTY
ncbi:MAG: hypothetical protein LLG37_10000 [Spirochaetia bacterium]|nr:hypothetical protein [Spirochaetia bacterium]